jgi:hypothetical protein
MDFTTIIQNIGPLIGILIGGILAYKLVISPDAGKAVTDNLQKSKIGIADLLLVLFAFLEGLVAANMGEDVLGDTYTTRFANHLILSMGGAFAGFICIKEVIDASNKTTAKNEKGGMLYSVGYLFIQWLQPILYFIIAMAMPVFNLMIIAKGCEDNDFAIVMMILGLQDTSYSFAILINQLSDVAARSLILVVVHILFTAAVALGSIDESKVKVKENKKDKKDKPPVGPQKEEWAIPGNQKLMDELSQELKLKDSKYTSVYLISLVKTAAEQRKQSGQDIKDVSDSIKQKFLDLHKHLHNNNEGLRLAKSIKDKEERTKSFTQHSDNKKLKVVNLIKLIEELK